MDITILISIITHENEDWLIDLINEIDVECLGIIDIENED